MVVMGGGGLFAVFPLAYAVVMPALYIPITCMLLALVFRGVAFQYCWRTVRWKPVWDLAFFGGSAVATLMQGIALGALVQGVEVADRASAGGWWDWLTLFSILTGDSPFGWIRSARSNMVKYENDRGSSGTDAGIRRIPCCRNAGRNRFI